jgi:hypothetical protein
MALEIEELVAWCGRQGFGHVVDAAGGRIELDAELGAQTVPLHLIRLADRPMLTVALALPLLVPAERQAAVAVALNLANSYVKMGDWVLNTDNGRVMFRVTLPTLGVEMSDDGMRLVVSVVVSTAESFAARIARVALEGADPSAVEPA